MKIILPLVLSSLLSVQVQVCPAQESDSGFVRKKVLLAYKFIADLALEPVGEPEPTFKEQIERGDSIIRARIDNHEASAIPIIVPYDRKRPNERKWPLSTFLADMHRGQFHYLYNDIFIVNPGNGRHVYSFPSEWVEMGINTAVLKTKPVVDIPKMAEDNDTYLTLSRIGSVAKMWMLEGEWRMHTIDFKPRWVRSMAPRVLEFDEYHVYVLERVISIEPITPENLYQYDSEPWRVSAKRGVKVVPKRIHDAKKE
ncbi:hypothetical protein [Parapedobacter sp.]